MATIHTFYACQVCLHWYTNKAAAEACESQDWPATAPKLKPGDVVVTKGGGGNREDWTQQPTGPNKHHGNCFRECCCPHPYFVVGAINIECQAPDYLRDVSEIMIRHRVQYHLHTITETNMVWSCYTYDRDHHAPRRVEPQPVLKGAKMFINKFGKHLL